MVKPSVSYTHAKGLLKDDFRTIRKSSQGQKDLLRRCGFLQNEDGEAYITAMQPDIIGEYFVLKYFESCEDLDEIYRTFLGSATSSTWAILWYLMPLLHDHPEKFINLICKNPCQPQIEVDGSVLNDIWKKPQTVSVHR